MDSPFILFILFKKFKKTITSIIIHLYYIICRSIPHGMQWRQQTTMPTMMILFRSSRNIVANRWSAKFACALHFIHIMLCVAAKVGLWRHFLIMFEMHVFLLQNWLFNLQRANSFFAVLWPTKRNIAAKRMAHVLGELVNAIITVPFLFFWSLIQRKWKGMIGIFWMYIHYIRYFAFGVFPISKTYQ